MSDTDDLKRAAADLMPEVVERLIRGEPVDPAAYYFRCTPSFETGAPAHQWLTRSVFVGSGARHPDRVEIQVYEVR